MDRQTISENPLILFRQDEKRSLWRQTRLREPSVEAFLGEIGIQPVICPLLHISARIRMVPLTAFNGFWEDADFGSQQAEVATIVRTAVAHHWSYFG